MFFECEVHQISTVVLNPLKAVDHTFIFLFSSILIFKMWQSYYRFVCLICFYELFGVYAMKKNVPFRVVYNAAVERLEQRDYMEIRVHFSLSVDINIGLFNEYQNLQRVY